MRSATFPAGRAWPTACRIVAACALVAAATALILYSQVTVPAVTQRTVLELQRLPADAVLPTKLFRPASAFARRGVLVDPQASEQPKAAATVVATPRDFDPQAYLEYNPDLPPAINITTAAWHYANYGHKEKRLYSRIPVAFTYLSWGGLCNQAYAHLAAVVLASELGADLVVPPALKRNSFIGVFTGKAATSTSKYTMTPFSSLFDQAKLFGHLRGIGLGAAAAPVVDQTNRTSPSYMFWDASGLYQDHLANAVASFGLQNHTAVLAEVDHMWDKKWTLAQLRERIKAAVLRAANSSAIPAGPSQWRPPVVVVDLQLPLYSLTIKGLPQARAALRQLDFAPSLRALADKVVQRMVQGGHIASERAFNGLHLRAEKDMSQAHDMAGGLKAFLAGTYSTCKEAGLNTSVPLYVASGLLSYESKDSKAWKGVESELLRSYASKVLHKEMFLSQEELAGLDSEQLAAADFLVMARCSRFVGYAISTWSLMQREYRDLHGLAPRSSNWLMQATKENQQVMKHIAGEWSKAACLQ